MGEEEKLWEQWLNKEQKRDRRKKTTLHDYFLPRFKIDWKKLKESFRYLGISSEKEAFYSYKDPHFLHLIRIENWDENLEKTLRNLLVGLKNANIHAVSYRISCEPKLISGGKSYFRYHFFVKLDHEERKTFISNVREVFFEDSPEQLFTYSSEETQLDYINVSSKGDIEAFFRMLRTDFYLYYWKEKNFENEN